MRADPEIRERLTRATSHITVDTEQALTRLLRASQRKRSRGVASLAVAAALLLLVVVFIAQNSPRTNRVVGGSNEPTGHIAAAERTKGSGTRLVSLDVASGAQTPIPVPFGAVTAVQWSPDGKSIAYTVEEEGGSRYALVVAHADGSAPVKLVEHEKKDTTLPGPDFIAVAWSPDGSRLAYSGRTIHRGRTVSVINADGTGEHVLDGHWESVSWSPDGQYVLLDGWPDETLADHFDLYRARPDGTDFVRLTNDDRQEWSAAWSPDGTRIVFARGDGTADDANIDVYVMDADGANVRRLTDEDWFDAVPVWSPDGKWIAFASNRDAAGDPTSVTEVTSIYVMRADGSDVRRVLDGAGAAAFPLSWTK